jgi:hypothetical protein
MDAMAGAFARLDFANEAIVHTGFEQIARKFNQNGTVYSEGYFTVDDSWINYATQNQNEAFGWTGNHSGYGVKAFGTMISNSEGFRSCMVRRAYKEVCRKDLVSKDRDLIDTLSGRFRDSGFKLKKLFQEVAVSSSCLSAPAANQVSQSETSLMEGYYEE